MTYKVYKVSYLTSRGTYREYWGHTRCVDVRKHGRWRACLHGLCFKFGNSPTQMCYGRYGLSRQVLVEIEFKVSFRPP